MFCEGDDEWRRLYYQLLGQTLAIGSIRATFEFVSDDELRVVSDTYILGNQLVRKDMTLVLK